MKIDNNIIKLANALDQIQKSNKLISMPIPNIVVVGGQSCGKSTLLSNIVGRDFLPTDKGMCTKCPIRIEMIKDVNNDKAEYKGKTYNMNNYARLKKDLQTDMSATGCTNVPITVKIYSPECINLTLIDLPGIPGDSTSRYYTQFLQISRDLCNMEENIILMVMKADDQENCVGYSALDKNVEYYKNRMIGVMTHLELQANNILDREPEVILKSFENLTKVSKWFGVTNCKNEQNFINKYYINSSVIGIENLKSHIQRYYMDHFSKYRNVLIEDIQCKIQDIELELKKQDSHLVRCGAEIKKFQDSFKNIVSGGSNSYVGQKMKERYSKFKDVGKNVISIEEINKAINTSNQMINNLVIDLYPTQAFIKLTNDFLKEKGKHVADLISDLLTYFKQTVEDACNFAKISDPLRSILRKITVDYMHEQKYCDDLLQPSNYLDANFQSKMKEEILKMCMCEYFYTSKQAPPELIDCIDVLQKQLTPVTNKRNFGAIDTALRWVPLVGDSFANMVACTKAYSVAVSEEERTTKINVIKLQTLLKMYSEHVGEEMTKRIKQSIETQMITNGLYKYFESTLYEEIVSERMRFYSHESTRDNLTASKESYEKALGLLSKPIHSGGSMISV